MPLYSSDQVITALTRAGFEARRRSKGSHQALVRTVPGAPTRVAVVVLGRREIPRGTLTNILKQAGLTEDEFRAFL